MKIFNLFFFFAEKTKNKTIFCFIKHNSMYLNWILLCLKSFNKFQLFPISIVYTLIFPNSEGPAPIHKLL